MPLYKNRNGVRVKMTVEEETQMRDEWGANKLAAEKVAYIYNRRDAYPNIGDQLDAILKQFNYMRLEGTDLVSDLDDIVSKWLQVKRDNPKYNSEEEDA